MDIQRFIERFDRLMDEKRFDEAEKLLQYWLDEAESEGDYRNRFTILNEMTGFYRMVGKRGPAFDTVEKLLKTVSDMGAQNSVGRATAYLNCATVYNSFNEPVKALELYKKAEELYIKELEEDDDRLAGLYNNMALAYVSAGSLREGKSFREADMCFKKALIILEKRKMYNEQAITFLNIADLEEKRLGPEAGEQVILEYLDKAVLCFEESFKGDFNSFKQTAEKCIPVFRHYGYFMVANDLTLKCSR